MRANARIHFLQELRDLGITSYQHADSDGDSFSVTFGPPPVVTAEADEDEQAEKLPALPKDAARLAYQLGNQ